jgi:hypothetical protein
MDLEVSVMRKALILCALLFAAGAAHAEENLLYIGAGLTNGTVHNVLATNLNLDNSEYKFFAGFKPPGPIGAEIEYLSFGSGTSSVAHGSGDAVSIVGMGYIPVVPRFLDVYGKAGISRTQLTGNAIRDSGPNTLIDDAEVRFTFGVGAQAHIGNLGARLEYQHYSIVGTDGANIVTLGVQVNLL